MITFLSIENIYYSCEDLQSIKKIQSRQQITAECIQERYLYVWLAEHDGYRWQTESEEEAEDLR